MMKKLGKKYLDAETLNKMYAEGYRYYVRGDFAITEGYDRMSGMPETTNNVYVFTDKGEAEIRAAKETWVFNPNIHGEVVAIPPHTKTWAEREAEMEAEKAARIAKRKANEAKRAAEAGMTVEEYKAERARKNRIETIKGEINRLKETLAKKEALLRELEK